MTAVAPAGAGTVQIVVTTPGGTSNGINFTYTVATPVITSVVPSSGRVTGGNTVTLTGSGFTGATAVKFATFTATFAVVSPTQLTAVAPPGSLGTVNITVTTNADNLDFGLVGCRRSVPHLQRLLGHLETSLKDLERAVDA